MVECVYRALDTIPRHQRTLSCAAGAAEPLCVSALRVSIVAAEPAGRGRPPNKVAYVARALDTTTRHQRTILAASLPAATASVDRSCPSMRRIWHSRSRSGSTKKCCPGGSTPEPPRGPVPGEGLAIAGSEKCMPRCSGSVDAEKSHKAPSRRINPLKDHSVSVT